MDVVSRADEDELLELLNTTPVVDGQAIDELGDETAGRNWLSARSGRGTRAELANTARVRDQIQAVVRGEEPAEALAPLIRDVALQPAIRDGRVEWTLRASDDQLFGARLLLAWGALEEKAPGRLRPCANPECQRFLIDRSHGNKAQWCSMALCGNRMKARRHYERTRAAERD